MKIKILLISPIVAVIDYEIWIHQNSPTVAHATQKNPTENYVKSLTLKLKIAYIPITNGMNVNLS